VSTKHGRRPIMVVEEDEKAEEDAVAEEVVLAIAAVADEVVMVEAGAEVGTNDQ